jgi:hypothetical protein
MFPAIDAKQFLTEIEATITLAIIVAAWAFLRPSMVRDYNERHPPPKPTARLMFVCVGEISSGISASITHVPFICAVVEHFKGQAPLAPIITLGGLLQLSIFREFERALLAWLHSTGHLHQD